MKIICCAAAGSQEKDDVLVSVAPNDSGLDLQIESIVIDLYEDAIRAAVREELGRLGVESAAVFIKDGGALDYVIRARVETAVRRGAKE